MHPQSEQFFAAIRSSHGRRTTAVHRDLITGVATTLAVKDGTVTDDSTADVRRSLSLDVVPTQTTWDALDTVGGEITVTQDVIFADGSFETVPMGVFIVDVDSMDYTPGGSLQISNAGDRYAKVKAVSLSPSQRSSIPTNMAWQEIRRLVEGAWNTAYPFPGWSQLDQSATAKVGNLLWSDGDRGSAISALCQANSVEVFFDRGGLAVLRPVPVLTTSSVPVWTVDASASGVMLSAGRTRDRTGIYNVLLVSTSATDVTFPAVEVKNTTAGDPLSVNGTAGYRAQDYTLPTLRNSAQARAAGLTRLSKTLGVAKQLTLESVGNPALDSEDVLSALLPVTEAGDARPSELHIADSLTHPLAPSGTQTITTRSTRPATDGS